MSVVSNTSPLILLAKIGRLELLLDLYDDLIVPEPVLEEVRAQPIQAKQRPEVQQIESFILSPRVRLVEADSSVLAGLAAPLGAGERAAISVAIATAADLLLLDDLRGRRAAYER